MLYINNPDKNQAYIRIIDEVFNLEANKLCFANGILLENANKIPYPNIDSKNTSINFKTNIIIIYMPETNIQEFALLLQIKLFEMSDIFQTKFGYNHLQSHFLLETNNEHFVAVKAKNAEGKRKILHNKYNEAIEQIIGLERSTILIYNNYYQFINNILYDGISMISQLVSILYDTEKFLNLENNQTIISSLKEKHFHQLKNIMKLSYLGIMSKSIINLLKADTKPNNLLGWEKYSNTSIKLCDIRSIDYEIIRHFSNIYNTQYLTLLEINKPIYSINFNLVKISKSILKFNLDSCQSCGTPLYDDVYMVFSYIKSTSGTFYCAFCMHSAFIVVGNKIVHKAIGGNRLYQNSDFIAKIKYPKKKSEIINKLPIDDTLKKLFKILDSSPFIIESGKTYRYTIIKENEQKYLGWCGDIYDLIKFVDEHKIDYPIFPFTYLHH